MRATHAGSCCKRTLEAVESGWRWTFETAGISVHGDTFSGEAEARADHAAVCQELYDGLNDLDEREDTSHPILILFAALSLIGVILGSVLMFRRRKAKKRPKPA